jgi:hypothetical protein
MKVPPPKGVSLLENDRTAFTIGAFFRVPTGEANIQSETEYPAVSTVIRDIRRRDSKTLRLFPTPSDVPFSTTWLSEALSRSYICPSWFPRSPPVV